MSDRIYVFNCCYPDGSIQKILESKYYDEALSCLNEKAEKDGADIFIARPGKGGIPSDFPPIMAEPSALCNFISTSNAMSMPYKRIDGVNAEVFSIVDLLPPDKSHILVRDESVFNVSANTTWYDIAGLDDVMFIAAGLLSPRFIPGSCINDIIDPCIFTSPLFDGIVRVIKSSCPVVWLREEADGSRISSCGKCVYCRLGTKQISCIADSISSGEAESDDIKNITYVSDAMSIASGCDYGKRFGSFVSSYMEFYRQEFETHIRRRKCTYLECRGYFSYHVLPDICQGCDGCRTICAENAIEGAEGEIHVILKDLCNKCGMCFEICPQHAIVKAGMIKPKTPKVPIPVGTWKR